MLPKGIDGFQKKPSISCGYVHSLNTHLSLTACLVCLYRSQFCCRDPTRIQHHATQPILLQGPHTHPTPCQIARDLLCRLPTFRSPNGAGLGILTANIGGGGGTKSQGCGFVGEHLLTVLWSSMKTHRRVLHAREAILPECRLALFALINLSRTLGPGHQPYMDHRAPTTYVTSCLRFAEKSPLLPLLLAFHVTGMKTKSFMFPQPFLLYLFSLFSMNNTLDTDLKHDELPDDASSWSSAFDPPKDLPKDKTDKPVKRTKKKKHSKNKDKRTKEKKSKKKRRPRSASTESCAVSEAGSANTMGDPMLFHRPNAIRGRACAKMLVRANLRCACHFNYVSQCPNRDLPP